MPGTTARYGIPYPLLSDPADIETDGVKDTADAIDALMAVLMPPGTIVAFGGSSASGWLLCDGTSYLRATYPMLFTAISTTYGSVDGTHFNVPNLLGRVPVGRDAGAGVLTANNTLGAVSGEEKHTLTTAETPAHTHGPDTGMSTIGMNTGSSSLGQNGVGPGVLMSNLKGVTGSTGGGGAHNNMPPYAVVNYIIKT